MYNRVLLLLFLFVAAHSQAQSSLCEQYAENPGGLQLVVYSELNNGFNDFLDPAGSFAVLENIFLVVDIPIDLEMDVRLKNCVVKFTEFGPVTTWLHFPEGKNGALRAENTVFFSCNYLWPGMRLASDSKIEMSNCQIEDAEIVFHCDNASDAVFTLKNCIFNRNWKVFQSMPSDGVNNLDLTRMNNCYLQSDGDFLRPVNPEGIHFSASLPISENTRAYNGIDVDHTNLTLGLPGTAHCATFQGMGYGIVSKGNSILNVFGGCNFYQLRTYEEDGPVGELLGGTGIYAIQRSELTIGEDQNSSFVECGYAGVLGDNSTLKIRNCEFNSNLLGVKSTHNIDNPIVQVSDCAFLLDNKSTHGIFVEQPTSSTSNWHWVRCNISGNNIHRTGAFNNSQYSGSTLTSITFICRSSVQNSAVQNNRIIDDTDEIGLSNNYTDDIGIFIFKPGFVPENLGNNVKVAYNTINYTSPNKQNKVGIRWESEIPSNSKPVSIRGNEIWGNYESPADANNWGIIQQNGGAMLFCNNRVDNMCYGFGFFGNNENTNFEQNAVSNWSARGLLVHGIFSELHRKGNQWYPDSKLDVAAEIYPPSAASLYRYYPHSDESEYNPDNTIPNDWFEVESGEADIYCLPLNSEEDPLDSLARPMSFNENWDDVYQTNIHQQANDRREEALLNKMNDSASVLLFPNPANQTLNLQTEKPVVVWEVWNGIGQLIASDMPENDRIMINSAPLVNGQYWINVKFADGNYVIKAFNVQH